MDIDGKKLYDIFEKKLSEISEKVGYEGENVGTFQYEVFCAAWDVFLFGLNVRRQEERSYDADACKIIISDPLWTGWPVSAREKWLVIPRETAEKILVLGLP